MVKHLEFRGAISFASPEMVFKFLYEDDAFTKFYHMEVTKDANASATSWTNADGYRCRVITFKPQFSNVPFFLQLILGGDLPPMEETQECRNVDKIFIIHSKLSVALPGGLTFTSSRETYLSPVGKGCEIVIKLMLEVQAWYGQDLFENYAETKAVDAFNQWLKLASVFCGKMIGMEEEPVLDDAGRLSDASKLPEEIDLHFGMKQLEGEEGLPSFRTISSNFETQRESEMQSNKFWLSVWTTFLLGIAAGLALGFLSNE